VIFSSHRLVIAAEWLMANPKHLKILQQSPGDWNKWREEHRNVSPDLKFADLRGEGLGTLDLKGADLRGANLRDVPMMGADLSGANLAGTDLREATLGWAQLQRAELDRANLSGADLIFANLSHASLRETNFSEASIGASIFGKNDLSMARGLETVKHEGPSSIGIDTIFLSKGKIPHSFLRGAGVPETVIEYLPDLLGTGIEFYSLFISYSTADEEFATRLHNDLQAKGVRCWFAPHDIESGKKIHEQVERAIHMQERTLVILSGSSIQKPWVQYELKNARKRELEENRPVLYPISICDYETLKNWKLFHLNADLAGEIREYYIPDFSEWKNPTKYSIQLETLVKSLNKKADPS
jgi:hypothetical protein